jgi:CTP:molybdopterin cytidylyltransferase MocA
MNRFIFVTYDTKNGQSRFDTLEIKKRPGDTPESLLLRAQKEADEFATDRDLLLVDVDTAQNYAELATRALHGEPDVTA